MDLCVFSYIDAGMEYQHGHELCSWDQPIYQIQSLAGTFCFHAGCSSHFSLSLILSCPLQESDPNGSHFPAPTLEPHHSPT